MNPKTLQVMFEEHPDFNIVSCYHKGKQFGKRFSKGVPFEEAEAELRRDMQWMADDLDIAAVGSCIFCGRVSF